MFSQLKRAIRQAQFVNQTGWSKSQLQETIHSRRDFLKASALLAMPAAVGVPFSRLPLFPGTSRSNSRRPVLILGGGIAGLAAGYTLKKAGVPFQILEASGRTGGRILTQSNFNSDRQFVELGAEYVDSNHRALIHLATEIGLEIQDMGEDDNGRAESELFFFSGRFRDHEDLVAAARPIAEAVRAAKIEIGPQFNYRNPTPAGLKWDRITLAEFLQSMRGRAEDWILDAIAVGYTLEMGREPEEQSVLNLFWQIDDDVSDGFELFGPSDETRRVRGGNSRLPMRLTEILSQQEDAIVTSTRVLSLAKRSETLVVTASRDGRTVEFMADQIICALPLSMLKTIDGLDSIGFTPAKLDCIRNMRYGQNAKIMMDFKSREWRRASGAGKPSSGWVMGDFTSQSYWETSLGQKGQHGILTNFLGGRAGQKAARESMRSVNLPELAKIFPTAPNQFVDGVAMNWNQMPYVKGSYICVGPGQYGRFFGAQMEPELDGRILFAGEHTSVEFMGYMNGACETGINAAKTIVAEQFRRREIA